MGINDLQSDIRRLLTRLGEVSGPDTGLDPGSNSSPKAPPPASAAHVKKNLVPQRGENVANARQFSDSSGQLNPAPAAAPRLGKRADKPPRKKREGPKYLTPEQLVGLFRAIANSSATEMQRSRDLAIFELAYGRGLRACEVGMLRSDDVREDRGGVFVLKVRRGKGSRGGEYRANDREKKALRAWLRVRGKDAGPLFPSRVRRPIGVAALDDLIKSYGAAAGLPREVCHFHVLRHSCGMRLAELDVPIEEAQDHLGHVSITNTQIYYQISNRRRRERDERLRDRW